jgi:hypothetical protein
MKNNHENTALMIAVFTRRNEIALEIINILYENNESELIEILKWQNKRGENILIQAAEERNIEIINKIITLCDKTEFIDMLKIKDKIGYTALHIAVVKNHISIVKQFINALDKENKKELIEILKMQNYCKKTFFIGDVQHVYYFCETVLIRAVREKNVNLVKEFLIVFGENYTEAIKYMALKTGRLNNRTSALMEIFNTGSYQYDMIDTFFDAFGPQTTTPPSIGWYMYLNSNRVECDLASMIVILVLRTVKENRSEGNRFPFAQYPLSIVIKYLLNREEIQLVEKIFPLICRQE